MEGILKYFDAKGDPISKIAILDDKNEEDNIGIMNCMWNYLANIKEAAINYILPKVFLKH